MGSWQQANRTWRIALGAAALALAPLLAACVANSYAGILLAPGAAAPELQALARRAQVGDKNAQLELGLRYEEGRGVARDLAQACAVYLAPTSGTVQDLWIYTPSTRGVEHYMHRTPISVGDGLLALKAYLCRVSHLTHEHD